MSIRIDKINQVKNLDLIYIYSTDSIFKNNQDKYIGIKIVYDNKYTIKTDYKDPNFTNLIKRVIDRYNKEKESKNIVLLGSLTKQFMKDTEKYDFNLPNKENNQIEYFKYENKSLNRYKNYLFETIKLFISEILKIETFKPIEIVGYNRKYKIFYEITGVKKESNLLINTMKDELEFKLGSIENSTNSLTGTIKEKNGRIIINFKYGEYSGNITYDALDDTSTKHISYKDDTYFHIDSTETLLEKDKDLINFYQTFINKEKDYNVLKVNDNSYISNKIKKSGNSDELLYSNMCLLISISPDKVVLTEIKSEGFSKYNGEYNVELEKRINEVIIRKINFDNRYYIIIESNVDNNYSYEIILLDNDIDLDKVFDINNKQSIEIDEIKDIKKYTKRSV